MRISSVPYRTSSMTNTFQKPAYITQKEIDYKILYEKERMENERLKMKIDELTNIEVRFFNHVCLIQSNLAFLF